MSHTNELLLLPSLLVATKKSFGTYHAELYTKPKRDPAWELNSVYG